MVRIAASVVRITKLFVAQFLTYGVFTWNARAIAHMAYRQAFLSDLLFGFLTYETIKLIGEGKTKVERVGYALGGACGSLVSMWVTHGLGS